MVLDVECTQTRLLKNRQRSSQRGLRAGKSECKVWGPFILQGSSVVKAELA